jgi:hypothetical protein
MKALIAHAISAAQTVINVVRSGGASRRRHTLQRLIVFGIEILYSISSIKTRENSRTLEIS